MAPRPTAFISAALFIIFIIPSSAEAARIFTIINSCKETVWPAITPGESFNGGGFALKPGQSVVFTAPVSWSGRIWGRTGCSFDKTGNGSCQTGACGTAIKCAASGKPPASLAEFTLSKIDYYDVSLVDGFNLPLVVTPINGKGNCSVAGCDGDLRTNCPSELAVKLDGKVTACRSACDVYNTDEYCCKGVHGNPVTCQPTYYSKKFKNVCPAAYSYAYDDPTSIFTCSGTDYVVSFCSSRFVNNGMKNVISSRRDDAITTTSHTARRHSRNQRACTYHNKSVVCSGSNGLRSPVWSWATRLALVLMISLAAAV